MTPRDILGQARMHTFEYVPYLASYIYSLRERETPGIGTAAVDREGNLYWDPEFVAALGREQTAYLVAHEVLHLIFEHHVRSEEIYGQNPSDFQRFVCNVAADLVIEQTLHMMRHLRPEGAVHLGCEVPAWSMRLDFPENRSMQEYYRLIMEKLRAAGGEGEADAREGTGSQSAAGEHRREGYQTEAGHDAADAEPHRRSQSAGEDASDHDQSDDDCDIDEDDEPEDDEPEDENDAWNDAQDELDDEWEGSGRPVDDEITEWGWDYDDYQWGWMPPPPGYDDDVPDPEAEWEEDDYDRPGSAPRGSSQASPPGSVPRAGLPGAGGSCADAHARPYETDGGGTWEAYQDDMAAQAQAAITQCERERPGSVPGAIRQAIRLKLRPTPDPFAVLRSAVCSSVASPVGGRDYSRRRRSRKQLPGDDQPLLHGRCTVQPRAVVIVDTSASMLTKEIQAKALAVIAQGLRKLGRVRVFCADTQVQAERLVATCKQFEWCGGGGTDMSTALRQVDEAEKPDSIVLVTDAATNWHGSRPGARVIVAYTGVVGSEWHRNIPAWCRVVPLVQQGDGHGTK